MWGTVVLVVGCIFGFIFGWLFRDWRFRYTEDDVKAEWEDEFRKRHPEQPATAPAPAATASASSTDRSGAELSNAQERARNLESKLLSETAAAARANSRAQNLEENLRERDRTIDDLRAQLPTRGTSQQAAMMVPPAAAQPSATAPATAPAPSPARPAGSGGGAADDLKKIKGIGPVLEGLLHRMGVTEFRQIARFSDADIERVAEEIETFPDRIKRDDWMGQARQFHQDKYGESA